MLKQIINPIGRFFSGNAPGGVKEVAKVFLGDRGQRETNDYDYKVKCLESINRYVEAPKGSWWGRFIAGLNMLPRPMFAIGVLTAFAMVFINPDQFAKSMTALELVKTEMWGLCSLIVTFYFGGRWNQKKINHEQQMKRIENYEKMSNAVLDTIERLNKREDDKSDHSLPTK